MQTLDGQTDRKKGSKHGTIESGTEADDKGKGTESVYKTPIPSYKVAPTT